MYDILIKASDYVSFVGYTASLILTIKIAHSSTISAFKYMAFGIGLLALNSGIWLSLRLLIKSFPKTAPYWMKMSDAIFVAGILIHIAGVLLITVSLYCLSKEYRRKMKMVEQVGAHQPATR